MCIAPIPLEVILAWHLDTERKSDFELLEHVIKGVHIEGSGLSNHRLVPRLLDHIDEDAVPVLQRPRQSKPERGSGSR